MITIADKRKRKKKKIRAREGQLEDRYILISTSNKDASYSIFSFKVMEFYYKTVANVAHNVLRSFKACLLNKHYSNF